MPFLGTIIGRARTRERVRMCAYLGPRVLHIAWVNNTHVWIYVHVECRKRNKFMQMYFIHLIEMGIRVRNASATTKRQRQHISSIHSCIHSTHTTHEHRFRASTVTVNPACVRAYLPDAANAIRIYRLHVVLCTVCNLLSGDFCNQNTMHATPPHRTICTRIAQRGCTSCNRMEYVAVRLRDAMMSARILCLYMQKLAACVLRHRQQHTHTRDYIGCVFLIADLRVLFEILIMLCLRGDSIRSRWRA